MTAAIAAPLHRIPRSPYEKACDVARALAKASARRIAARLQGVAWVRPLASSARFRNSSFRRRALRRRRPKNLRGPAGQSAGVILDRQFMSESPIIEHKADGNFA